MHVIHYHGTPIGGSRQDAARFLLGRHALVPFARPDDLAVVMECAQSFVLDNSAFTYWRKGGAVDVVRYLEWVESVYRHPGFDWCLIPDVIDGSEEENRDLVFDWKRQAGHVRSVPVWHMHESFDWLDELANTFDVVALGSSGQWKSVGTAAWWARMAEAMAVVCDALGRPRCRLHGLRMLNPKVFTRLPLSSADSTNAAVNCGSVSRFGMYVPPTASQRAAVIAERIECQNSAPTWQKNRTAECQP